MVDIVGYLVVGGLTWFLTRAHYEHIGCLDLGLRDRMPARPEHPVAYRNSSDPRRGDMVRLIDDKVTTGVVTAVSAFGPEVDVFLGCGGQVRKYHYTALERIG